MARRQYTIEVDAPPEKVSRTMLEDATFRQWTRPFCASETWFQGDWSEGSELRLVGLDPETGGLNGMYAIVREHRPNAFVSLEHQGVIENGVPDATSEAARKWRGTREEYAFEARAGGGTRVVVEQDVPDDFLDFFATAWPEALQVVKALAERA